MTTRAPLLVVLLVGLGWIGCGHAKRTDAGDDVPAKPQAPETKDRPGATGAGAPRAKPSEVPVASSPAGLLKPGAEEKIRDELSARGFEGSLRAGLKRFQAAHDLPATGAPDVGTVRALGLEPDDIFRKAKTN
jgi:hypothetical protein